MTDPLGTATCRDSCLAALLATTSEAVVCTCQTIFACSFPQYPSYEEQIRGNEMVKYSSIASHKELIPEQKKEKAHHRHPATVACHWVGIPAEGLTRRAEMPAAHPMTRFTFTITAAWWRKTRKDTRTESTDGTGPFLRVPRPWNKRLKLATMVGPSWQSSNSLGARSLSQVEMASVSASATQGTRAIVIGPWRSPCLAVPEDLDFLGYGRGKRSPFQRRVMAFGQSVLGYCESATDGE